jgi:hypothetical protein
VMCIDNLPVGSVSPSPVPLTGSSEETVKTQVLDRDRLQCSRPLRQPFYDWAATATQVLLQHG